MPKLISQDGTRSGTRSLVQTESKLIKANRPDVIVIDQEQKKCLLIGAAIPAEGNSSVKVKEKLSKS